MVISIRDAVRVSRVLALVAPALLAACATVPTDPAQRAEFERVNDPWEPMNRAIFDFNDAAYTYVLFPAADAYEVLPKPARDGVHNALGNVNEPVVFLNKTLQADLSSAGTAVARFLINTIFGFGGLIDVATHNDIQEPGAGDFGATLYSYGMGEGPYLVLPLYGPSNPRDTIGKIADGQADPFQYVAYTTYPEQLGMLGIKGIDLMSQRKEDYREAKKTSLDFYAFLRSAYRQNRQYELATGTGREAPKSDDSFYDVPGGGGIGAEKKPEHP